MTIAEASRCEEQIQAPARRNEVGFVAHHFWLSNKPNGSPICKFFLALMVAIFTTPARADIDLADFKGQCGASGDWCAGYVQAAMDMSRTKLCPPWGNYPHPTAPLMAVQGWLEKNERAKGGTSRVVEIALAESFPCKR